MGRITLLAFLGLTLPLAAQADDFGGSFGGDTAPVTTAPPAASSPTPDAGDGFGGSFDGPSAAPAPTPPADPDGFGGSFGDTGVAPVPDAGTAPSAEPAAPPAPIVIDQSIYNFESRDYWVPPAQHLRNGNVHGPTPVSLPGGYVLSTQGLVDAMVEGVDFILIDVLGGDYALPGAYIEPGIAQGGSFQDRVQQQTEAWLRNLTGGDAGYPIVMYCSGPDCWLSYNAALRAINAGYEAVYWYRGGLRAWDMAGLPLEPAAF